MSSTQPRYNDAEHAWTLPMERVDCDVNGEIVQLPIADLECVIGGHENEDEWCSWVEFRRPGDEAHLHRSVRLHLKKAVVADALATAFS